MTTLTLRASEALAGRLSPLRCVHGWRNSCSNLTPCLRIQVRDASPRGGLSPDVKGGDTVVTASC
jgi:hypothetical protein